MIITLRSKVNIFQQITKNREKQKKNDEKMGIFTQNQFSTKSIFLYGCNSKINHCIYMKFSQNVYVSVIYIQFLMIQIFTKSVENAKNCNISLPHNSNIDKNSLAYIIIHTAPNIQQSGTHLPAFFLILHIDTNTLDNESARFRQLLYPN
ncbi:hypothetical protein FWK35_00023885 [Aphis craccivora]|uniref:Uncharacterized protein n=1 Tax=Aphis craccivora TaxID=307492 RepID=A0A6G0W1G8_APHCR|nr:hypothetical protein FWK35_00023885 [Aphis craccivora]